MQRRSFLLLGLQLGLLFVVLSACPGPKLPPSRPLGGLVLQGTPKDAQVFVDDRYQGTLAALAGRPLTLPAGVRRVEVRHGGYFAAYHEVTVVRGVRQKLTIDLRKEPF